jgi:hypothetical protein
LAVHGSLQHLPIAKKRVRYSVNALLRNIRKQRDFGFDEIFPIEDAANYHARSREGEEKQMLFIHGIKEMTD